MIQEEAIILARNTLRGERFVVSCDCGYIYNCEIY
jgi:hypothetical protein